MGTDTLPLRIPLLQPLDAASLCRCAGDTGSATHVCLAGEQCGGTLLPTASGGQAPPPYAHGVGSYFGLYGTGQFDGQNSGHDFLGTVCSLPFHLGF